MQTTQQTGEWVVVDAECGEDIGTFSSESDAADYADMLNFRLPMSRFHAERTGEVS